MIVLIHFLKAANIAETDSKNTRYCSYILISTPLFGFIFNMLILY